jgi:hypothetical protein
MINNNLPRSRSSRRAAGTDPGRVAGQRRPWVCFLFPGLRHAWDGRSAQVDLEPTQARNNRRDGHLLSLTQATRAFGGFLPCGSGRGEKTPLPF